METKFNFKSQICTDKNQSERLLALGLKKETADMCWQTTTLNGEPITYLSQDVWMNGSIITNNHIPAWSLHRLLEMMPRYVHTDYNHYERTLFADSICYYKELYNDCGENLIAFDSPELYDRIIHMYEWLIKEGYFNKKYLEE